MTAPLPITLRLASEAGTAALAVALAPLLSPGDTLLLSGPIGAGKTHFARALIQARLAAAGLSEDVPSPTFTLVQTYSDGDAEIWHADLYRLSGGADLAELGLDWAFEEAIVLVEWPERLGSAAPKAALAIDFAQGSDESSRVLTFTATVPRWAGLVGQALDAAALNADV